MGPGRGDEPDVPGLFTRKRARARASESTRAAPRRMGPGRGVRIRVGVRAHVHGHRGGRKQASVGRGSLAFARL